MNLRVSRKFQSAVEATANVVAIAGMFGIGVDKEHEVVLYTNLEVDVGPGKVVFITGDSGAGKSCCKEDLRLAWSMHGQCVVPELCLEEQPIIELLEGDLNQRCGVLASAGLGEAFVMMRTPRQLSDGQRYRFSLARALQEAREGAVIFMDEFCAMLDRRTAMAIAYNVRRMADRGRVGFVLATTHDDLIADLNPDTVIRLSLNQHPVVASAAGQT